MRRTRAAFQTIQPLPRERRGRVARPNTKTCSPIVYFREGTGAQRGRPGASFSSFSFFFFFFFPPFFFSFGGRSGHKVLVRLPGDDTVTDSRYVLLLAITLEHKYTWASIHNKGNPIFGTVSIIHLCFTFDPGATKCRALMMFLRHRGIEAVALSTPGN